MAWLSRGVFWGIVLPDVMLLGGAFSVFRLSWHRASEQHRVHGRRLKAADELVGGSPAVRWLGSDGSMAGLFDGSIIRRLENRRPDERAV